MTKATAPQAKFIRAILKHGGERVPGTTVFDKNDLRDRRNLKTVSIEACKRHGWVVREERARDGMSLWTVTAAGRAAVEEV